VVIVDRVLTVIVDLAMTTVRPNVRIVSRNVRKPRTNQKAAAKSNFDASTASDGYQKMT
jgi:hypothetical protein